jgi:hypothetical protein
MAKPHEIRTLLDTIRAIGLELTQSEVSEIAIICYSATLAH